jgi:23S rRNA pseudouridine2605 synthase
VPGDVLGVPKRLDKYLRDATDCSLAQLRMACVEGRVTVQDELASRAVRITDPGALVYPGDLVWLDGRQLGPRESRLYLMLHKPVCVTTTVCDPDEQEDLSKWLRDMPVGVFPVGRLDRMTSGLLLFTNDGDFSHAMLSPLHHVSKQYELTVRGNLEAEDSRLLALARGVLIAGCERLLMALVDPAMRVKGSNTELSIRIAEGKHRQVRKMCRVVGLHLVALHRSAIGSLELGELAPGAFRHLSCAEAHDLLQSAGGLELIWRRKCLALQMRAHSERARGRPMLRLEQWLERTAAVDATHG